MWTSTFSFWKITRLRGQAKTKLELLSIMWHNMPLCWYFGLSKHFFIPSTTSKHFRKPLLHSRDETMSSRRNRISKSTKTCRALKFANRKPINFISQSFVSWFNASISKSRKLRLTFFLPNFADSVTFKYCLLGNRQRAAWVFLGEHSQHFLIVTLEGQIACRTHSFFAVMQAGFGEAKFMLFGSQQYKSSVKRA